MLISKDRIVPELLKQCPELRGQWEACRERMEKAGKLSDDKATAFVLVMLLLSCYRLGRTDSFPRFFEFIERLFTEGDNEVQTIALDGYLQELQRSSLDSRRGPDLFAPWMHSKTKQSWYDLWRNPSSEKIVEKIDKLNVKRLERLREYKVSLTECASGERAVLTESLGTGMGTKFGGDPDWIQNDERPHCHFCKRPMTFVAQIDSVEHFCPSNPHSRRHAKNGQQWMFGDVGMIYVFFCFYCNTTQSVVQWH